MAVAALFVILWSTGFIGARLGLPYAEPLTFLTLRFGIVLVLLAGIALASRAPWPDARQAARLCVSGILVHGLYLGGVFSAIDRGMSPAVVALIVGLQPLLTGVLAALWLKESTSSRQWFGLLLGLAGVIMVLSGQLGPADHQVTPATLLDAAIGLAAITLGTLYQKRFGGGMDLRSGTACQYLGAVLVTGAGALLFEEQSITWTAEFAFALGWLILVLSIGATMLLMLLIRRGAISRMVSLFYLVPPVTAVMAYAAFGQRLGWVALAGMAVASIGVALSVRPEAAQDSRKYPRSLR